MPRKNRRKVDQQDIELDQEEKNSKWASILNNKDQDEDDEEELQPKKEIFNFDFSKEHLLLKQKQPVKKEEPKIVLTPEEQAELERRMEKQRIQREEKEKIKRLKKQEKKVIVDKLKQQERIKREQEEKTAEKVEQIIQSNKSNSDSKKILLTLFVILVFLGLLQYQKDIYSRLSKFRLNTQVNYYEVLETSSGASDSELRNQYKRLVTKYHPDKNPNCHSCKEKFNGVMQAWEVLGNPQKRQHYDQNSGFVSQIKSNTLTLTPNNYEWLLSDSSHIWIVQVYDSTSEYCHFFASFWQDFSLRYKGFVRTARIDVWQQSEMKSYIPFKFQIFPAFYSLHHGEEVLCQLDFERPMRSLQLCAEQRVEDIKISKIKDWSEAKDQKKLSVIVGGGVKLSTPIKLIHSRFSQYITFFYMNDKSNYVEVMGREAKFQLNVSGSKIIYQKYRQFLEGTVVQQKWSCEVNQECKERGCLLLLDGLPMREKIYPYPIFRIKDYETFSTKIDEIKNITGMFQKFDVGFYLDGKIELGYFSQIGELNPDNGEVIDLPCRAESYFEKLQRIFSTFKGYIQ